MGKRSNEISDSVKEAGIQFTSEEIREILGEHAERVLGVELIEYQP